MLTSSARNRVAPASEGTCPEADAPERPTPRRRGGRKVRRRLITVLALAVCVWLFHAPLLRAVARGLIAEGQRADCQMMWIRSGDGIHSDGDHAYDRAAALHREDASRRVLLITPCPSRVVQAGVLPPFHAVARRELVQRGVPGEALVVVEGAPRNRWEEARLLAGWLGDHSNTRVLLLCDRFGSRRSRRVLDRVLDVDQADRVDIVALPDRRYDETNWWKSRRGVKSVFYGYVALVYAWCQGEYVSKHAQWDPDDYERTLELAARAAL